MSDKHLKRAKRATTTRRSMTLISSRSTADGTKVCGRAKMRNTTTRVSHRQSSRLRTDEAPNQQRWHYPANFEGTVGDSRASKKKGALSGSRWDRTRNSSTVGNVDDDYASNGNGTSSIGGGRVAGIDEDVPEWGKDYGSKRSGSRTSKKSKGSARKGKNGWADNGGYVQDVARDDAWGDDEPARAPAAKATANGRANGDVNWDHEF